MKKCVDIYYLIKVYDPNHRRWFAEPEEYGELNLARTVAKTVYRHCKPMIVRIIEERMEVIA